MAHSTRLALALCAVASLGLHTAAFVGVARHRTTALGVTQDPTGGALVGETLDVEPPSEPDEGEPEATPSPGATPTETTAGVAHASARPSTDGHVASPVGSAGGASTPSLFGAVGVRYATDLATTFTRGFPQAASFDSIWLSANLGSAGSADVVLVLSEDGHLVSTSIQGSPSDALRKGIERTLALLRSRTFTARSATTKLRVTARVSRDDVHDGLHGDVFALSGGSFAGQVGTAFFALPAANGGGRRVDLDLRLVP